MRLGLIVHPSREAAAAAAREVVAWAGAGGHATRSLEDVDVGADERVGPSGLAHGCDVVVSFGGDGTLLRSARLASLADVPVLGAHVGHLGFLTEIAPSGVPACLEAFERGELRVDERIALTAEAEGTDWDEEQWALNEVLVEKRARHRVITLAAAVSGEHVTTFSGDGVIVATPTGSTAYSFSARGPIVSPDAACLLLTPVSPHMVFDRAIVLAPDAEVVLEVQGEEPGILAADGRRSLALPVGSRVRIRRAARPARLLRRPETETFYAKLRRKFSLPEGPRGGEGRPA